MSAIDQQVAKTVGQYAPAMLHRSVGHASLASRPSGNPGQSRDFLVRALTVTSPRLPEPDGMAQSAN